ncbi:hypothetical protein CLCR_11254 [Cladophialophora carrionii]|uniref:NADP-dependent oxidoreductase domain-containing protein n=1 Tax=Cladophialophora carrionii TaxID=86049 RepID=A0A1C1CE21_9EURO|nr:hypothetical protein CLCR_11254 [Cladophialophora carrionii]
MTRGHKKELDGPFLLAFGTGSTWRKEEPGSLNINLIEIVKEALQSGYCHLDTAEPFTTSNIRAAFDQTLQNLGVEYVDLYLLHDPYSAKTEEQPHTAWVELEGILDSGKLAR